jgi:dynein heavy chain, axonemal
LLYRSLQRLTHFACQPEGAESARQLQDVEDKIIQVLSSSEGNILEDEAAVNIISASKALSKEISRKQAAAVQTEQSIDEARAQYAETAKEAAALFFGTVSLAMVDFMYEFSLSWFIGLYRSIIGQV